jgi:membrane-associated phospholipid phosphatase
VPWIAASVVFFVYLVTVAELVRQLESRAKWRIRAGAAVGTAAAIAAMRLPPASLLNVWILPPALLLLGYWTSGLLFVAPMPAVERRLLALDARLRVQAIAARTPRLVAELLELAYVGIYPLVLAALGIALQSGVSAERFWTVILVIDYICFGMLPWIQTRPPRAFGVDAPWRSAWRRFNQRVVESSSIRVNTFPSGHAAEGLAVALLLLGGSGWLVAVMFAAALAVSAGAVLGRYHYAADAIAGWAVALIVFLFA